MKNQIQSKLVITRRSSVLGHPVYSAFLGSTRKSIFISGCQKHIDIRKRGIHRQGERLRPLENLLRQRQVQEAIPALRPVEVDGHRVPQGVQLMKLHFFVADVPGNTSSSICSPPPRVCVDIWPTHETLTNRPSTQ
jgi:hypothetical protein